MEVLSRLNDKNLKIRRKKAEDFQKGLKVSNNIITISRIYGTIVGIKDNIVCLHIAPKIIIKTDKYAIVGVTKKDLKIFD